MTAWDFLQILNEISKIFPPFAASILLVAAVVIFIIGFSRRGLNFVKYGFGKMALDETFASRFDRLDARLDSMENRLDSMENRLDSMEARLDSVENRLDGMEARITAIETNHFGHLKNFLTELTSILVDRNVINNSEKTRLDNQLRGM